MYCIHVWLKLIGTVAGSGKGSCITVSETLVLNMAFYHVWVIFALSCVCVGFLQSPEGAG